MPVRKPATAAAARPAAGTPKSVSFAAQSAAKAPMAHRLSSGTAVTPPAALAAAEPEAEAEGAGDDVDMYDEPAVGLDDEPMQDAEPAAPQQQQQQQQPAAAAAQQDMERPQAPQQAQQAQQETPGGEAAAKQPAGAAGKTPWRTPAPVFNEAKTPATSGPASGWQLLYQDEGEGEEGQQGAGEKRAAGAMGISGSLLACLPRCMLLLIHAVKQRCSQQTSWPPWNVPPNALLQMWRLRQRLSGRMMAACLWTARDSCERVTCGTWCAALHATWACCWDE